MPINSEPVFVARIKVKKLNQVLVSRLPKRALARFARRINARVKAAIGPVPGKIPENAPKPNPRAIFCGESLTLKSFR